MKRSELPCPAPFLRGLNKAALGGRGDVADRFAGPPKHPVISIEAVERGVRCLVMVHQDGYGPAGGLPKKVKEGRQVVGTVMVGGVVPPLSDKRRYVYTTLPRAEYEALPVCTYEVHGQRITNIEEVGTVGSFFEEVEELVRIGEGEHAGEGAA